MCVDIGYIRKDNDFTLGKYTVHNTYSRNNMCQKCGGNCGLWVLIEIIQKKCPENMKKIVGALWELPAK